MSIYRKSCCCSSVVLCLGAFVGLACLAAPAHAASFQGLGDLAGGIFDSRALAVSSDGSVVVGTSWSASGIEAFRWTSGGGMVGLGDLAGGIFESQAVDVSSDGSVVVGYGSSASGRMKPTVGDEAYRWTSGGGMVGLGDLPGGSFMSHAWGVSSDGSVVVGDSWSASGYEAFRWTSGGGMVGLGDLAGGIFGGQAWDASSDGSVVVGNSSSASGIEAFRWTSGGGMVGLGDLPGGSFLSHGRAVSAADGSVVVGRGTSGSGTEAFRWTSEGGMVGLGDLPGGIFDSWAFGVSSDGSVVVGYGNSASGDEAFIWDSTNGMRSLTTVLTSLGVDLTGWTLTHASAVSPDGTKIVGLGTSPSGTEAWLADISGAASVPGDVNNDGTVNAVDIQLVINEVLGLTTGFNCDINGDGPVNAIDVQLVINAALGLPI